MHVREYGPWTQLIELWPIGSKIGALKFIHFILLMNQYMYQACLDLFERIFFTVISN